MIEADTVLAEKTPILLHADNIEWADAMDEWKNDAANKKLSKAGDDRTPPWRWIGCLNYDDPVDGVVTIPAEYIMKSIMGGAAQVPLGKGKGTFKSLSQSGLLCEEFHWPLLVNGKTISMRDINACKSLKKFTQHREAARDLGFELFVKRVRVGQQKHIRVRPLFRKWSIQGRLLITDEEQITKERLLEILTISGRSKGLGDWRPGAPYSPGSFGMFKAELA